MRKTAAQYQKEYRERKKIKEGELYHEKERERVKKYYKPVKDMTTAEKKKIREKNCAKSAKHRQKKKEQPQGEYISSSFI